MLNKKIIVVLLTFVMVIGSLAACGGTPSTDQSPDGATPAPDNSQTPSAGSDAGTPNVDKIKKAGKLVMLTNAAFHPFEYLNKQNEIAGVDPEIAQAIADELGVKLEIVDMDFDGIVMAIQNGQGDLALAGMTANDERRESIDFSINYLDATQLIIVPENSDIKSVEDLKGKSIGVQAGTTGALFARDMIEDANVNDFKTGPDAGTALANGQLDAVVLDEMPSQKIVAANKGLVLLEEPLTVEQYAIGIMKGRDDLKAVVDSVLEKMLAEGKIDELIAKHMAE